VSDGPGGQPFVSSCRLGSQLPRHCRYHLITLAFVPTPAEDWRSLWRRSHDVSFHTGSTGIRRGRNLRRRPWTWTSVKRSHRRACGPSRRPRDTVFGCGVQINRAKNAAMVKLTAWRFFQLGVGPKPGQSLSCRSYAATRAQQKAVEHSRPCVDITIRFHFFVRGCLPILRAGVSFEQTGV